MSAAQGSGQGMEQPAEWEGRRPLGLDAAEFAVARPVFVRAMHIVKAMLGDVEADVVMLVNGKVWGASLEQQIEADHAPGAERVRDSQSGIWIVDASKEPLWRDPPAVHRPPYLRFFA